MALFIGWFVTCVVQKPHRAIPRCCLPPATEDRVRDRADGSGAREEQSAVPDRPEPLRACSPTPPTATSPWRVGCVCQVVFFGTRYGSFPRALLWPGFTLSIARPKAPGSVT